MSRLRFGFCVLVLFCAACARRPAPVTPPVTEPAPPAMLEEAAPQRVILFIGDGMGVGALTAATYSKGAPLAMFSMPHLSWMTTHEYEFITTESASSATAIATGRKTHYEAVSVTPGTVEATEGDPQNQMQTLHELAKANGLGTGLVATSRINHATPAAFAVHRHHRRNYEGIAQDLADSELDVLFGAGWGEFTAPEGTDPLAAVTEKGWYLARNREELAARPKGTTRVAALFHPKDMPFLIADEPREMPLPEMVGSAIELLDEGHPQGWVLMVEGSFIDWCEHNLDIACATAETLDLDRAVEVGLEYARGREDTLVVATADHETAGVSVIDPSYAARYAKVLGGEKAAAALVELPEFKGTSSSSPPPFQHLRLGTATFELTPEPVKSAPVWGMTELEDARQTLVSGYFSMASRPYWTSEGRFYAAHTPTMVPIFAEGAGARRIVDARDNADLGKALREVVARAADKQSIRTVAPVKRRPKNVIFFIGDGMGIPAVTGAYYYGGGLAMTDLPYRGIVSTHAVDGLVNDSAASATAMATGQRARRGSIGRVVRDGVNVDAESILERAERRGIATGLVTTTSVAHATPAAFYAHREGRGETTGIAEDFLALASRIEGSDGVDLLLGGGANDFPEATHPALRALGYTVETSWPPEGGGKFVGLYAADAMQPATFRHNDGKSDTPTLAQMTQFALKQLAEDPDGFFLMVEGGQIDWRLHEARLDASVFDEVKDLDQAIAAAVAFAAERDDTLIVVTSDHDHTMSLLDNHYAFESGRCGVASTCGGPVEMLSLPVATSGIINGEGLSDSAAQGDYAPPRLHLQYAWPMQEARSRVDIGAGHSANLVPLFAYGPWGDRFEGFLDQPQIGELLMQWAE